jgi:hypothetical protein
MLHIPPKDPGLRPAEPPRRPVVQCRCPVQKALFQKNGNCPVCGGVLPPHAQPD